MEGIIFGILRYISSEKMGGIFTKNVFRLLTVYTHR